MTLIAYADEALDTAELTLSPELLAALRHLAPRRRHRTFAYVLALAVTVVAGVAIGHVATRSFVTTRWHDFMALLR